MQPQSSKVSHPSPFAIHPNPPGAAVNFRGTLALGALALFTIGASAPAGAEAPRSAPSSAAASACLFEPERDSAVLAGLESMYRMDYAAADSIFAAGLPVGSPGSAYFRGLNLFNSFNDRGDTASLFRAESLWSAAAAAGFRNGPSRNPSDSVNYALYRGLSTLQLSYVANLTRRGVKSAHLGLKAAGQLRPHADKAEAAAALALFDYYKADLLKGVDWLPFLKADAAGPLRRLEESIPRSRYLRDVLQTSLLWLYYDAGRFTEGLALIEAFLAAHPGNRTYRQIRADFLFRRAGQGRPGAAADLEAARAIHAALLEEYAGLMGVCPPPSCIPLGYLSSVGNLAKIYGKLGKPELRRKYIDIWSSSRFEGFLPWLPASLRREVDSRRK